MNSNMKLNEDTLRVLEFSIIGEEKQNLKSIDKPKKDADMVNEIVKIIKKEVNRESRD